jgi:recombination associated protein RdgC
VFRSVRFFRLASAWPDSEQSLSEQLNRNSFTPCTAYRERSAGWESPSGDTGGLLSLRVGGADLLQLRTQIRLLPAAAVNEALIQRVEEYRERMQAEPSRREKRKLKEQLRDELLPKALLKSERTRGFVIASEQLIGIDTTSEARVERFLEHLRASLGTVDAHPIEFKRPVGELLMRIFLGDAPRGFVLGTECKMQDPADRKATVRCVDMDLADPSVRKLVKDGMQLTQLGLEFGNILRCVVDQSGNVSKLRLVGLEASDEPIDEDPRARLDAGLVLLTGSLRQLMAAMASGLDGFARETGASDPVALTA